MRIIRGILKRHLPPNISVWVFGSRAKLTTTNASDLDLVLEGDGKLGYDIMDALKDDFEESDLPYSVDVVDLNTVNPAFKQIVNGQKILLLGEGQNRKNNGWLEKPSGE